jgi:hypothetical protein
LYNCEKKLNITRRKFINSRMVRASASEGALGSGKQEVGSGKWEVGSGKWEIGNVKCEM